MNLLQILTNENKILINILAFFISAIEGLLFCIPASIITGEKFSIKRISLFTTTIGLLGGIFNLLNHVLICDILNIIVIVLSMKFILKLSIKNSFASLVIAYITLFVSEYIANTLIKPFSPHYLADMSKIPSLYVIGMILAFSFYCIICALIQLSKSKKFNILKIHISLKSTIIINLLLGITTIALVSFLLAKYIDNMPIHLPIIVIITLLLYFSISMYSLIRTNLLEKTEADLENEKLYNKTLTHLHDNIRGFKHDFDNIVQSIGGYITLNDMEGLTEYYKRLLEDCKMTNNLNLLNPETINNPSIYSLLTNKYYLATEKGINMTFSIFTDLSHINFSMYEFSRILGILLDNAIEAAEESDQKTVNIEFTSDNKKQLFIISNSCKDTNISTTQIFEKGYSTKNRNSGFGLWHVHKVLEKNTNLDLFTTIKDNIFSQQLAIYY